ncbi:hypothetical protein BC941DRAFT_423549 [Chlamydoabsidia padenii]|nr:hypothetical protein BC941DRAFT_423549 [Chlamydoabsidia padenii]
MAHPFHQSASQGGLQSVYKWLRFLVYFVLLYLFWHLYLEFQPLVINNKQQPIGDFSWYKTKHARMTGTMDFSTTHLTSLERFHLEQDAVARAHKQASLAFNKLGVIPQLPSVRARIDYWTRGRWVPESRNQLVRHQQDPLYSTCDNKRHHRPETQYRWQTSDGQHLPTPTSEQWCQVLNGRHILLVGDLVQYQLHELFLDSLKEGSTVCYGELNCKDHTICTKMDTRLRYLRNDILADNKRHSQGITPSSIVTWPFVSIDILESYPILIMNRSPVMEDDDTFITSMIQTLTTIRRTVPDTLIIYRSSPIGHPYCDDARGPLIAPLSDDEKRRLPFGWAELDRRNAMARVIIEQAGGVFVDLAALVATRPDGHVGGHDCLRYCIPGPLDAWLDVLYQVFTALNTVD